MMLGLFSFVPVLAQTVGDIQLENPLGTTEITDILGNVVKKILTILGSISLVVFVAGGFLWLTSAGNAEKIKTGTNTMLYAIIGLFIIFSSYAILNMLIGGVTGGSVGGSEEEGGSETIDDTQDKLCKDYKPEWSCLPIEKCDGVKVEGTEYMKACAAAYQTCINNKCPGDNTPNIKCCKPKAEVVDRASGSGQSVGDACGGTAHPTWSCTNILNCNINLEKKESVTAQRAVCKKTPDKCVTGKCAGDNNIVCCEKAPIGSCVFANLGVCVDKESKGGPVVTKNSCEHMTLGPGEFSEQLCEERTNEYESIIKNL